ncbi:ankyrin repeat domain-containing protein [Spirochaeta africana]|uniref:Ankyrin repeat-containing protein n=1 Tax=Spirochaeta africana (strain ATCC 700263 / DSM 8902 / Z-7692) TaxID=889378 RepID=H9UJQ5_SPIAZ|nr:ankyrin repeat domain-containing protein [Spirochaeta africana]AFG37748.1 ankyrin repeat-containing protein [Spirochaeta africana DSM 8902]
MKVGIFFCGSQQEFTHQLLQTAERRSIPAAAYRIGQTWEQLDGQEFQFHLRQITHIIILITPRALRSRWFAFLNGYASGGDIPVYLCCRRSAECDFRLPQYVQHIPLYTEVDELMDELLREQDIDSAVQRIENAKAELTAMGYPLTEEALVSSAEDGIAAAVSWFLQIGFSPDTLNKAGVPILNLAARQQHLKVMRLLLESGADVNLAGADRRTTVLMESAVQGAMDAVDLVLEYAPDLDRQSASGQTALMMAIGEGQLAIAMRLLDQGAAVEPVDALGMTAYKYAKLFDHQELIERLEQISR